MTEIWLTVEGCSFFPLQTCIFSASQLFLPQTRVFSASWLVFFTSILCFQQLLPFRAIFEEHFEKLQLTCRLTDIPPKRLQAISDFFGKLKESKAPETTSETEGLRKLEGT